MRARRADYTVPGQLSDIPYRSLDLVDDSTTGSKASTIVPSAATPESRNPCLERNSSAFSKVSTFSKGPDLGNRNSCLERSPLLVSEDSLGSPYSRARSSHFEWNSCIAADRFAFSTSETSDAKLCGKSCAGPPDRFPLYVAGEYVKHHSFDHTLKAGDGGSSSLLQRQSSGSSFTDSLFSSDVPLSTLSPPVSLSASDSALLGSYLDDICKQDGDKGIRQQCSWAQQTEQSYNLQLALALRLVAEAGLSDGPLLLPCFTKENKQVIRSAGASSVRPTALRFWVNGALTYADRINDGFYHIWGMNPYVWAICNHPEEGEGRIPTLDLLKAVDPVQTSMEVIIVDKHGDSRLCDIENQAFNLAFKAADSRELAELLGKLVSQNMGGAATTEQGELMSRWQAGSMALKECLNCIVLPIGSISVGVCRHRALLYKALADSLNLPCRIARGCKYCGQNDGVSCLVFCGTEREFLVDLISSPGDLSSPAAFLKSQPLPTITSPLRLPELKLSETVGHSELEWHNSLKSFKGAETFGCELGWQSSLGLKQGQGENYHALWKRMPNNTSVGRKTVASSDQGGSPLGGKDDVPLEARSFTSHLSSPPLQFVGKMGEAFAEPHDTSRVQKNHNLHNQIPSAKVNIDAMPQQPVLQVENQPGLATPLPGSFADMETLDERQRDFLEETAGSLMKARNLEQSLALDGLDIAWDGLILKERIGAGSFGTVHRADWNGSDVAVKVFTEQDFFEERLNEFMREVAIMKRTRHPNVVLFMGAVTKRPHLSIVTEYLPRGSLFRLLHRPGIRELLDERRCIRMALDVAKGVNYLHRLSPPIVHRDLKSPNLLVDKTWTVKVCDFGLSRLKAKTFLSSRSAAGTAEWMAPEVLRDEPSNEKSDVYSFGVILWEIFTFQQPWNGLSPAQVVGAVGFQHRRLQIPKDINPEIAALIESCWANDPWKRPSFASIMESLKQLQRSAAAATVEIASS